MSDESNEPRAEAELAELAEITPIRYGIFESTVGQIVARAYRVDPLDHTRDELIHVMDGVRDALDARERMKRLGGWHGVGRDNYQSRKARLVEYLRDGDFISDLYEDDELCLRRVVMTWDETLTTLSKKTNASKPSRVWLMGQLDWFRLESAIDAGEPCGRALARELGISPTSLVTLCHMYGTAGRYCTHTLGA